MTAAQVSGGARELREPGLVDARQREREQRPGGLGAHGREIGEVHGESAVADGRRRRARREMHALDQRVRDEDELA